MTETHFELGELISYSKHMYLALEPVGPQHRCEQDTLDERGDRVLFFASRASGRSHIYAQIVSKEDP